MNENPDESQAKPLEKKEKIDVDSTSSSEKGLAGLVERSLRSFRVAVPLAFLCILYLYGCLCMGICFIPGLYLLSFVYESTHSWPTILHFAALGTSLAAAFFLYGFTLIFVVPFANFILPMRLRPWRGIYYSLGTIPWYFHNALAYLVRYTFLEFITPTPYSILYFRLMGMKIGRGVQINTTNISDPCLLELEDKVTIGGSATLICHYGAGGFLIIEPVRIRKGATIGMKATIMGDVEIGENSKVLANSLVMPKTRIPAGEIWGGVPAVFIKKVSES